MWYNMAVMSDNENEQIVKPLEAGRVEVTSVILPTPEEKVLSENKEAAETVAPETPTVTIDDAASKKRLFPTRQTVAMPQTRDELAVKIEKIMEDGLTDAYGRLSPIAKQEFKLKGEQTAGKIRELLQATTIQVKKIFKLLLEWLKMLPGVNHFFLEQEAKIKTDRIITLHKR